MALILKWDDMECSAWEVLSQVVPVLGPHSPLEGMLGGAPS